jgi:hypothetical protein
LHHQYMFSVGFVRCREACNAVLRIEFNINRLVENE